MNQFEQIISNIDNSISIKKEDRQVYTSDFDMIRDHLLNKMKEKDAVFAKIYAGPSLFGSYIDNVRINKPDEFDVHFLLQIPFYEHIRLRRDNARPGYVKMCLYRVLDLMKNDSNHSLVYETFKEFVDERQNLCRNILQNWLEEIIIEVFKTNGDTILNSTGNLYKLVYLKRGTAHTIKAISSTRKISIDFVPAFKFNARSEWLAERPFPNNVKEKLWFAVPKPTVGPRNGRHTTFSICAPQIERHILTDKYNLKSSFRLFKSLRNRMRGSRLKSYFIKTIYLHENDKRDDEFWKQPAGFILIQMIGVLLHYLDEDCIPFYWSPSMNLLDGLTRVQVQSIKTGFKNMKSLLDSYYHQPLIKESTLKSLFSVSKNSSLNNEYL